MKYYTFAGLFGIVVCLSACAPRTEPYLVSARQVAYLTGIDSISYAHPATTIVESFRRPNIEVFEYFQSRRPVDRVLQDPVLRSHIVDTVVISDLGLRSGASDKEIVDEIQNRKRVLWSSEEKDFFSIRFERVSRNTNRILADLHVVSLRGTIKEKKE